MFTFTASAALKGMAVLDSVGVAMGWRFFDHAAHLSGLLSGVMWAHHGNRVLWGETREAVMRWYHENVRGGDGRKPPGM